jgi:hypothetical protein
LRKYVYSFTLVSTCPPSSVGSKLVTKPSEKYESPTSSRCVLAGDAR